LMECIIRYGEHYDYKNIQFIKLLEHLTVIKGYSLNNSNKCSEMQWCCIKNNKYCWSRIRLIVVAGVRSCIQQILLQLLADDCFKLSSVYCKASDSGRQFLHSHFILIV